MARVQSQPPCIHIERKAKFKKRAQSKPNISHLASYVDKQTIVAHFANLNYSIDRILRAFNLFEDNYGNEYDFNALMEIILRLKKKDKMKNTKDKIKQQQEEKRDSVNFLFDYPKITKQRSLSSSFSDQHITPNYTQIHQHFKANHLSLTQLSKLTIYDNIDHRDSVGRFCPATIIEIDECNRCNVKIHYYGYDNVAYDEWSNFKNESFRFAAFKSISRLYSDCQNRRKKFKIGSLVLINPIYTIFGNVWYQGIISKFDKKSDQMQVAFKPFNCSGFVLYWCHIDNIDEIKAFDAAKYRFEEDESFTLDLCHLPDLPKESRQIIKKQTPIYRKSEVTKKSNVDFSKWSSKEVILWLEEIENGKFCDVIYDHFKQQIEVIQLKGYELCTLNETALKFAGLLNKNDRILLINHILNLVNTQNTLKCAQSNMKMIDYMMRPNNVLTAADINKQISDGTLTTLKPDRVLNEIMGLWK